MTVTTMVSVTELLLVHIHTVGERINVKLAKWCPYTFAEHNPPLLWDWDTQIQRHLLVGITLPDKPE